MHDPIAIRNYLAQYIRIIGAAPEDFYVFLTPIDGGGGNTGGNVAGPMSSEAAEVMAEHFALMCALAFERMVPL